MNEYPRLLQLRADRRFLIGGVGSNYEREIEERGVKNYDKVILTIEKLDSSRSVQVTAYFQWMYTMNGRKPQFIILNGGYELLLKEGFRDMEPIKLTILKVLR